MPAFRWDGVRDERRQVSDCRIHCDVGDSWGLHGDPGAEIWAVKAGVEGRKGFRLPALGFRVSAERLDYLARRYVWKRKPIEGFREEKVKRLRVGSPRSRFEIPQLKNVAV